MRIRTLFILCFFVKAIVAESQTVSVKITDAEQRPLEDVTAALLRQKDSALIKTALSDKTGTAEIERAPAGRYIFRISLTGYQTEYLAFEITGVQPLHFSMQLKSVSDRSLDNVTVSGRKPFVQRTNDRIIINVANSIVSAGSSVLDVLEKSPGVRVDVNDAIQLRGKNGVIIMIDGKQTPLSGNDLTAYLKSIQSSQIERIDIITNPSAKYDAAGNAGIIDIRFKKDQRLGTNGSVTVGYGVGKFWRVNDGLTLNHRNKKMNLYGSATHAFTLPYNNIITTKEFFKNNNFTGAYVQDNLINRKTNSYVARIGADYYLSSKTTLGALFNSNITLTDRKSSNTSAVYDASRSYQSNFNTRMNGTEHYKNYFYNLNLKHQFKKNTEISVDFDGGRYKTDWASRFSTVYVDGNGANLQPPVLLNGDQHSILKLYSVKTDFTTSVQRNFKIESGVKSSFVNSDNLLGFINVSGSAPVTDADKSNHFVYEENINAAYLNLNQSVKKFEWQIGIRTENTNVKLKEQTGKRDTIMHYTQIFPSMFFTYKFSDQYSVNLTAGRRIDRPGYGLLNPLKNYVDPSFVQLGDPSLRSQLTWSTAINFSLKKVNLGFEYSTTINNISIFLLPDSVNEKLTLQVPVNMRRYRYYGFTAGIPVQVTGWWNVYSQLNTYYDHNIGYAAKTAIDRKRWTADISVNSTFNLKHGLSSEITLAYNSGTSNGIMMNRPSFVAGAGIQKTLWKNKANLRLNVTDIFWRAWPRFNSAFAEYHENLRAQRDTRIGSISFVYRFGNSKVAAARKRTTASDEERRRAGGN